MSEIRESLERELKLKATASFELPDLGGAAIQPRIFVSTYHDTHGHRLARHGVTLRHRVENGKGLWQLKLPRGVARLELEVPGAPAQAPEELAALLAAYVRLEPLVPVARLRTRRTGVRADGAEVVHDRVAVLDDQKVTGGFDELEVELLEGDEKTLRRIEKALRKAGAGDPERRPKVFQALDLDFEPEPEPRKLPAGAPATLALRTQLHVQYERLLAHDPGTRLGTDPEELHQFRVATRRLRAFLRAGAPLLDAQWAEPLRAELGWLGGVLGPARDLDVLIDQLQHAIEQLGPEAPGGKALLRVLGRERTAARRALRRALSSARYFSLLDRLDGPAPMIAKPLTLEEIQAQEHRKLRKAIRALTDDSPDVELHKVRIKVKRARYAAELRNDRPYVRAAKVLQDVLGDHQDAVIAQGRLRDLALSHPAGTLAAGRLVEREALRARQARAGWLGAWKTLAKAA